MVGKSSIVDVLGAGLRATTLRKNVIANNLANINTPGFRRNAVKFEKILADKLDSPGQLTEKDLREIKCEIFKPMNTDVDDKGNDANIEVEMGELLKSHTRHKTYLRMLNKIYKQMELAMQDR